MALNTCVSPKGSFIFGVHKPSYRVANQRENEFLNELGRLEDDTPEINERNFPAGPVVEESATWIYEIPNPFPFRGTTFIKKDWADRRTSDPSSIKLTSHEGYSLSVSLMSITGDSDPEKILETFRKLPPAMLLAAATTSNDPKDLIRLAEISCPFVYNENGEPIGLRYEKTPEGKHRPVINDHPLFEALVNNPCLPDIYKWAMVLKPGVQGTSEIVGEYTAKDNSSHVFEYLRRNSYIAGGHYASNMAHDAVRYSVDDLSESDISGLRHLYYQRTFLRIAEQLELEPPRTGKTIAPEDLEQLRLAIHDKLSACSVEALRFTSTLWGWNYGFDFAPSLYRLHASHQQIHQQYAMIPAVIYDCSGNLFSPYGCGDLISDWTSRFREKTGRDFFSAYLKAIRNNTRTDGNKDNHASLIVHEDSNVLLFVPKAQTSQWELQLVCLNETGNILEADQATRDSIDYAILTAVRTLGALGAKMITTIEYPKRFDSTDRDQRLLYSFLPKLPESPGAFSEAQLRWINGHYPEDFAEACRLAKMKAMN